MSTQEQKTVDPITSEQNFKGDKRPFIMVQAYLFGAVQRGLMEINADKKQITKLDYTNLKQDTDKLRTKKGNILPVRCHFVENKKVLHEYRDHRQEEDEEDEDEDSEDIQTFREEDVKELQQEEEDDDEEEEEEYE